MAGGQLVRVGQLVGGQARTSSHHKTLSIEHTDLLSGNVGRDALLPQRGDDQVGQTDGRGAGAEKEDPLVLELTAGDFERVDHASQRHAGRALDVVVVARNLVAVAGQEGDGVDPGPVLEVQAAVREDLLNRGHELVDEGVQLFRRRTALPQADVERVGKIGFVICAGVQIHGQQTLRRHARSGGVQLQLSDRNAHAVGAKVAQPEDAAGVGHADEAHALHRPVSQHLLDVPLPIDRQIHAEWAAHDVVELQAGLADRRVVHDFEEAGRVRHQRAVEQRLVRSEKVHQVDEPVDVGVLVLELEHDALQLSLHRLGQVGNQPDQSQRLPLGLGKAVGLVDLRVVQNIRPAFVSVLHENSPFLEVAPRVHARCDSRSG